MKHVAIFWDYENCSPPSGCSGSIVADNIRHVAHDYGCVNVFKAYSELSTFSPKMVALRSELQSSGVSLIDCPHNGKKDVADKMMIVDMLTYAMDTPPPATIILITGDRDFAYAISILRWRKYNVVVIAPYTIHSSVKFGASAVLDWDHVHSLGKHSSAAPDLDSPERLLHSFDDTKDDLYSIPNHDIPASTWTYNVQQATPEEDVFNTPTKAQYSHGRSASAASEPIRPDTLMPWDTPAGGSASPYKMPAWRGPASGNVKLGVSPSWHPVMEKADLAPVNDINFYLKSRSRDASAESVSRNEESYFVAVEASEVASTTPTSTSASDGIATLVNTPSSEQNAKSLSDQPEDHTQIGNPPATAFLTTAPLLPRAKPHSAVAPIEVPSRQHEGITSDNSFKHKRTRPSVVDIPEHFYPLITVLQEMRAHGDFLPLRASVGIKIANQAGYIYTRANVKTFKEYTALAKDLGLIRLGSATPGKGAYMGLEPAWYHWTRP